MSITSEGIFPIINTIDDVLPHIEGCDEFIIAERLGGYKVINYVNITSDTFRPVSLAADDTDRLTRQIRRECRGIVFDPNGIVARRPYHKFKNIDEDEENLIVNVDFTRPHVRLEKLDGSMISPIVLDNGEIYWGTKMLAGDFHDMIVEFLDARPELKAATEQAVYDIILFDCTPMFEFCSRKNRIVVDHPEDRLVMTGIRYNINGNYVPYDIMVKTCNEIGIEVVGVVDDSIADLTNFVNNVRDGTEEEGVVVRFEDGSMFKVKNDWYVTIHKTKDDLLYERNIITLILDEKLDDVLPFVIDTDRVRLETYQRDFNNWLSVHAKKFAGSHTYNSVRFQNDDGSFLSRKDWAIKYAGEWYAQIVFKNWEVITQENLSDLDWYNVFEGGVKQMVRGACISNSRLAEYKPKFNMEFEW